MALYEATFEPNSAFAGLAGAAEEYNCNCSTRINPIKDESNPTPGENLAPRRVRFIFFLAVFVIVVAVSDSTDRCATNLPRDGFDSFLLVGDLNRSMQQQR